MQGDFEIKVLELKDVIGHRRYSLDLLLRDIANNAMINGSTDGLQFVKQVLSLATTVDLPESRKFMKMAVTLYNILTEEQIAELQKNVENELS